MKILVFSDSHGRMLGMYDAVEREAPDGVLHLGDHVEDAQDLARSYPALPFWYVRGNNDYEPDASLVFTLNLGGLACYLTHGHRERVSMSSVGILPRRAREAGCSVAFFGHTHRPFYEEVEGVTLINPGSISLPRGGPASYARLTVARGALQEVALLDNDGAPYQERKRRLGWF